MPGSNSKVVSQKAATLARTRENQRRCRARRREHIAELERRLQEQKDLGNDGGRRVKQLEHENRRLKALLEAAGMPSIWVESFLKLEGGDAATAQSGRPASDNNILVSAARSSPGNLTVKEPTPGIINETDALNISPINTDMSPMLAENSDLFKWPDEQLSLYFSQLLPNFSDSHAAPATFAAPPQIPDIDAQTPCSTSCCTNGPGCLPFSSADDDATPCSVAFELVRRNNIKGLDMVEIYVRLWSGFSAGKKGKEDCTVNNKVLFGVLDHVSG